MSCATPARRWFLTQQLDAAQPPAAAQPGAADPAAEAADRQRRATLLLRALDLAEAVRRGGRRGAGQQQHVDGALAQLTCDAAAPGRAQSRPYAVSIVPPRWATQWLRRAEAR
jgi:hypothetical protein